MARHKNVDWKLSDGAPSPGGGTTHSYESIQCAYMKIGRDGAALLDDNGADEAFRKVTKYVWTKAWRG